MRGIVVGKRALLVLFVCGLAIASTAAPPLTAQAEGELDLELVWTCPLHREITEAAPGTCSLCERELIQTLVQQAWSCPIHTVISEPEAGKCPICDRDLYLMTEEVRYVCPMHADISSHEPGTCSICNMNLVASTSTRPHQDHNPKHGGIFFMAPDNWHHLEGAYPEEGVFRVYLFDNFSQPLDASAFSGRAVLEEEFDADTRETRELEAYPMVASADGAYLEARVGSATFPREITAKLQFESDGEFERFDFVFADLSIDAPVPASASTTEDFVGRQVEIPATPEGIVHEISVRSEQVRELVNAGGLNEIYLPALQAKDLAVALEAYVDAAPVEQRPALRWALKQLVRSAWLLDDYGDLGNREKVGVAFELFNEAVEEIRSAYP